MGVEERLDQLEQSLEEKIKEYDLAISRADAVTQINNLMGRYAFYYQAQEYEKCGALWARRDDSVVDVGLGKYVGYDKVKYAYSRETRANGIFRIHLMVTPVIEVAADGKTARGVYFSPGVDTFPPAPGPGPEPYAAWCWIKYGVDFIKENGEWYIWRLLAYGLFHTNYEQSWLDKPKEDLEFRLFLPPEEFRPEGFIVPEPSARRDWHYASDRMPELDPVPPEPYNNWDDVGDVIACHIPGPDPERVVALPQRGPFPGAEPPKE